MRLNLYKVSGARTALSACFDTDENSGFFISSSSRGQGCPRSYPLGFTLIEVMVVLVLIAIMSAVIVSEMKGTYQDALLRSTSRELVSVMNLAYSRAIAINQIHRVRIDRDTGKYIVERRVRSEGQRFDFVPVNDVAGSEGKLDQRVSIQIRDSSESGSNSSGPPLVPRPEHDLTSNDTITFYSDGTADQREILLQDQGGHRLGLQINPTTARVRIVGMERN